MTSRRMLRFNMVGRRQQGVALITVLLIFALIAVLAAAMLERGRLTQRSVANLIGSRQVWHYALGGEAYARQLLVNDLREGEAGVDLLTDGWASADASTLFRLGPSPTGAGAAEQVEMTITIADLQARFNLNSVVTTAGAPEAARRAQFVRLLAQLGLDAQLADQWQDWVDADREALPHGGEDGAYGDFLTANRHEAHPSVLRLLPALTAVGYQRLTPHVTVLPAATPINVNTASVEVLRALSPIIDGGKASQIVSRQQRGGFDSVQTFIEFVGGAATGLAEAVSVSSSYFEVTVMVNMADYWQRLRTVLHRDNNSGAIHVLARERVSLSEERTP